MRRISQAQIRARARAEAARIQSRAKQVARDLDRQMERRIDFLTHHGERALTEAEIKRLGREAADYIRRRMY